jgi:hypothetical protein
MEQKINFYLLFILCNDVFSSSDYIASNERMLVNNELERMWKEAVVESFNVRLGREGLRKTMKPRAG